MNLSFITPTAYIKDFQKQGDFILALSHLIDRAERNEYEKAIKEAGLPIWLDNGAFEKGKPEGIDSLLNKARRINAELVFAPDFWEDAEQTKRALDTFIYIKNKIQLNIKTGVVVQAKNWEEFINLYKYFLEKPEVDIIGINHYTTSKVWQFKGQKGTKKNPLIHKPGRMTADRIEVLKFLEKNKLNTKPVHLLGLGGGYQDVIYASKNLPWVKSNDTSAPFWSAKHGIKMDDNGDFGGKIKEKVDFNFKEASLEFLSLAQYNINKIKSLC